MPIKNVVKLRIDWDWRASSWCLFHVQCWNVFIFWSINNDNYDVCEDGYSWYGHISFEGNLRQIGIKE